jgi:hypothetical protein
LTGPRTAGQSRVVMAAVHATLAHVNELARRSRRLVEEGQETAINGRRSQNSERVRAHLYEREFRAKPVSPADGASECRRARGRIMRRTRRVPGPGAVPPDERDMRLGRERPPKIGRRTVIGGWQRGSLTPQMPPSLLLTAAPTATPAAKSAAFSTRAKLLIVRNIAKCDHPSRSRSPRVRQTKSAIEAGGPLLPGLWSPRFFFAFVIPVHRHEARSRGM